MQTFGNYIFLTGTPHLQHHQLSLYILSLQYHVGFPT